MNRSHEQTQAARARAATQNTLTKARRRPPRPVSWFHPSELIRTAFHAALSTLATGYLDRRETLAALDRDPPPQQAKPARGLITPFRWPAATYQRADVKSDAQLPVWVDFVADVGDSWEATFATATLIARRTLRVRGCTDHLPRAQLLVLGGDLVYPTPRRNYYRDRLKWPFVAAFPTINKDSAPALQAIPGNHDWYDGLTSFVREFCQLGELGGWRLTQRRSYFATRIAKGWWVWGIDIALDSRVDAPQQAYFINLLAPPEKCTADERFEPGDRIILCTAKPVWLRDPRHSDEAYRNLTFFVKQVIEPHKGTVPVIIAGDLHHYCRYASESGKQLIVCGGGGSYIVGTHHLPKNIRELSEATYKDTASESGHDAAQSRPAVQPETFRLTEHPYPSATESQRLAAGALLLTFRRANWPFCLVAASLYWLMAWPDGLPRAEDLLQRLTDLNVDRALAAAGLVAVLCIGFAVLGNRGRRWLLALWGAGFALAHIAAASYLAPQFGRKSATGTWIAQGIAVTEGAYLVDPVAVIGGVLFLLAAALVGGTITGIYLVVSDRWFGLHRNEVFSAQSIIDYRSFLRMKIEADGSLTLYPIGLRRVPRKWRLNVRPFEESEEPLYEPTDATLEPHLIEGPLKLPRELR